MTNSTSSLASRLVTLESNYTNIATSVTSLATASNYIVAVANSVTSIISEFNTLNAKFDTLTTSTGATVGYVDTAVANSTGSFATRVNTLESNYTTLNNALSSKANSSDVTTLVTNSTASFATRVNTLESNYTTLNGAVSSKANSSDVTTAITNSTASITTRVGTIESNYVTSAGLSSYATQTYVNNTVATSTGSFATRVNTLESTVGTQATSITNFSSSIDGVRAKYGVTIDNNGAITGYEINSGGSSSTFTVKADNFKIYTGSGNVIPFSVSGSTVNMANAVVTGSLAIGSSPARSGTTMTGTGAAIANDGTFAFGNSSKSVVWDGTTLTVNGSIISTGNIADSAVSTAKVDANAITQSYVARAELDAIVGAPGGFFNSPTLTVDGFVGGFIEVAGCVEHYDNGSVWIKKSSGPNGYWWSNPGVQSGTGSLQSPSLTKDVSVITITHYWIPLTEGSLTFVVENQTPPNSDPSPVFGSISILAATFKR